MGTIKDMLYRRPGAAMSPGQTVPPQGKAGGGGTNEEPVVQPTAQPAAQPTAQPAGAFTQILNSVYSNPVKTPEQLAKEEKKRKRDELFAKIGDGIRVFSNLYATTKGAPNSAVSGSLAQDAVRGGYDKLQQDYEARKRAYLSGVLKTTAMDLDELHRKNAEARAATLDKRDEDRYQEGVEFRNKQAKQQQENWQKTYDATQTQQTKDNEFRDKQASRQAASDAANRAQRDKFHKDEMDYRENHPPRSGNEKEEEPLLYTGRNGKQYAVDKKMLTPGNINRLYKEIRRLSPKYIDTQEVRFKLNPSTADKWTIIQEFLTDSDYSDINEALSNDVWKTIAHGAPAHGTTQSFTATQPKDFSFK